MSGSSPPSRSADQLFGVEVEHVQEVLRYHEMHPVPLAPPAVGGLINLRGQVITAVDLRVRLGLPPRPEGTEPMNVIVRRRRRGRSACWSTDRRGRRRRRPATSSRRRTRSTGRPAT